MAGPPRDGKKAMAVLVVDDDEEIREVITEALVGEGYVVRCASNGKKAIEQLQAGLRPGVILLDLMMPVMDGWQFRSRQLADPQLASIPVVIISAGSEVRSWPNDCGCLRKPFDLDQLYEAIASAARTSSSPERPERLKSPGPESGTS
jgi:CheY-like chemotaxis protein